MFLNSPDPRVFLREWVYQYLKYPEKALRDGTQGRVQVDFIIEKDGSISNVRVSKGVSDELDAEAVKVISASPKWKPGRVDGEKVRTSMTIPVEFRLEKKAGKSNFGIKK
jgi:TonB family protein